MADGIEVRDLVFDCGPEVPRHWHGGRRAITLFFDNLSIFFPAGERFFIAAVKAHVPLVQDPGLLHHVRAFCGQEGVHSREHAKYNRMLAAQGYPAPELERALTARLGRVADTVPPRGRLAITCALEHFTAAMGHVALSDPRVLAGAHPEIAALWRWHAAEEMEHKAVAFDVFQRAGGGYVERVSAMLRTTLVFWWLVLVQQIRLMRADGCLSSMPEWLSLGSFLFVAPGLIRKLFGPYLAYFRPGFHPAQIDCGEPLRCWRAGTKSPAPSSTAEI